MTRLTSILPGDKGADFVALTDPIKDWLLDNNIKFVLRYVVPAHFTSIGKDYQAWETAWYAEHGICPISNFERTHTDATRYLDDAAKGREYGEIAANLSMSFGFPIGAPIFVSVDQDIWKANIDEAEAYVRAFAEAIDPYPIGIYGDDDIAYRCRDLNPIFWRANAWGWDGEPRPVKVHIQQHRGTPPGVDPNTALAPFTAWDPGGKHDPLEEEEMQVKTLWKASNSENVYCLEDGIQISPMLRQAWRNDPNIHLVEVYDDPHPQTKTSVEYKAGQRKLPTPPPIEFPPGRLTWEQS